MSYRSKKNNGPINSGDIFKLRRMYYIDSDMKFLYKISGEREAAMYEFGTIYDPSQSCHTCLHGSMLDLYTKAHWGLNKFTQKDIWRCRRSWEAHAWWS